MNGALGLELPGQGACLASGGMDGVKITVPVSGEDLSLSYQRVGVKFGACLEARGW